MAPPVSIPEGEPDGVLDDDHAGAFDMAVVCRERQVVIADKRFDGLFGGGWTSNVATRCSMKEPGPYGDRLVSSI